MVKSNHPAIIALRNLSKSPDELRRIDEWLKEWVVEVWQQNVISKEALMHNSEHYERYMKDRAMHELGKKVACTSVITEVEYGRYENKIYTNYVLCFMKYPASQRKEYN